jgi:diguanylate cyclase (GGDEF)-like protein
MGVGWVGIRNVSIRVRLFILFTLPVLAIVSTRTLELQQEHGERLTAAYDKAIGLARSGIERQEGLISEMRTLLQVLSRVPDIAEASAGSCRRLLLEVAREKPWLKGLWVVEPDGRSVCSTVPGGIGLTFADKHYFRAAIETRTFVIEHYWVGRLRGLPAAVATLPVLDNAGNVKNVIMGSFDLDWLVSIADEVTRSAGATFLLVDESGVVLARHPEIESLVERNFSNHPLVKAMGTATQGQFEMPDLDGTQRIFAFARLPGTHARLAIGLSRSKVLSTINWQTWVSAINLAIVCLLGLLAAWIGGEKLILEPIRALARTAAQFGAGDYKARAPSYSHRNEFGVLANSLNEMAEQLRARESKLIAKVDRMTMLAEVDPLTGLANRRRFDRALVTAWKDSIQHRHALAVLVVDVDYFKLLNDEYGHVVGDKCLQEIGQVLQTSIVAEEGLAARFGGEEFAILLPVSDEQHARTVSERIRRDVEQLGIRNSDAPGGFLTVSIGFSVTHGSAYESAADLIQNADAALYEAKRGGRNLVCAWESDLPAHASPSLRIVTASETDDGVAIKRNIKVVSR